MGSSRITVTVREDELRQFLTGPHGPVYQHVDKFSRQVAEAAKRLAPSDSGHLAASIDHQVRVEGFRVIGRVGTHVPYGIFLHEGTGIYGPRHTAIVPTRGQFLRFKPGKGAGSWGQASSGPGGGAGPGGYVFARSVRGVPANPFLWRAMVQVLKGWPVRRLAPSG